MRSYRELLLTVPAALILLLLLIGAMDISTAHRAACADNLRQIGKMAQHYTDANNGMIVPVYSKKTAVSSWNFWPAKIAPYSKDLRNFYCPADPSGKKALAAANDLLPVMLVGSNVSYGLNYFIASSNNRNASQANPYNINRVADPAYVIYFGDAEILQLRPTRGCWQRDWNPVHDGGANYLLADGHVEFFTGNNPGVYDKIPGWKQDRKRWRNWK